MKKAEGKMVIITRDGPYQVVGRVPLNRAIIVSDKEGASESWISTKCYEQTEEPYFLCRCGDSDSKPYCDGHHMKNGFKGREKAGRPAYADQASLLPGPAVNLMDDETLCVGARFCDRGSTAWGLVEESDKPENRQMAVEEACACPSGRLTVVDHHGNRLEPELPVEISLVEDPLKNCRGPLWIKGGIVIQGFGEDYEVRNRVTLCRCGHSENAPYCDGSHYECQQMKGLDKEGD